MVDVVALEVSQATKPHSHTFVASPHRSGDDLPFRTVQRDRTDAANGRGCPGVARRPAALATYGQARYRRADSLQYHVDRASGGQSRNGSRPLRILESLDGGRLEAGQESPPLVLRRARDDDQ